MNSTIISVTSFHNYMIRLRRTLIDPDNEICVCSYDFHVIFGNPVNPYHASGKVIFCERYNILRGDTRK